MGVHVQSRCSGDGVLIGGEKEELPAFGTVEGDEIADVGVAVVATGVLIPVRENGQDDFAGSLGLGHDLDAGTGFLDRATDGIQQGGAPARDIGGGGELRHLLGG